MLSPILSCFDPNQSVEFYEYLGFKRQFALADDNGSITFASVKLGEAEILIGTIDFVEEDKRQFLGTGIQLHIELPPELSINDLYRVVSGGDIEVVRSIEDTDWGETVFVINDPDGYNLMFAQQIK